MGSTISGSDSPHEDNAKVREYYRQREEDRRKAERNNVAEMEKSHLREVQDLNRQQELNERRVSQETEAAIKANDLRHQKDIKRMQKINADYMRQRESKAQNMDQKRQQDYEVAIENQKFSQDNKLRAAQTSYSQARDREQAESTAAIENYRRRHADEAENIQRDIGSEYNERSASQERRHLSDKQKMAEERNAQSAYQKQQIAELKRKHQLEMERHNRLAQERLNQQANDHQEVMKDFRAENKFAYQKNQDQYSEALTKEQKRVDTVLSRTQEDAGRQAEQRDKHNSKVTELEKEKQREKTRDLRQKERELYNLRDQQRKVLEVMFDERQGMVKEYNRINHHEINSANRRADEKINNNYAYFRGKVEDVDDKNQRDLNRLREDLLYNNAQQREKDKLHISTVVEAHADEKRQMQLNHDIQKDRLKNHHFELLDQERYKNADQRQALEEQFKNKVKEMDLTFRRKVNELDSEHKKNIIALKDKHQKELTETDRLNQRNTVDRERFYQSREKNQQAKFDYTMSKVQEAHHEELRKLNAQYRENLRQLVRDRDIYEGSGQS